MRMGSLPADTRRMTTGRELLDAARAARKREAPGLDDLTQRAALLACLLSSYETNDLPLIRAAVRAEMELVLAEGDGCGDVLLAGCWLLFMLGDVRDSALVWEAKNLNFDTYCYIDSVFLIPNGVSATGSYARGEGLDDLADYVEGQWIGDVTLEIEAWRTGSFFAKAPLPDVPVADLAAWLRQ